MAGQALPSAAPQRQPEAEPSLVHPQIVRRPDVRGFFPPVARRLNKSATVLMSLRIDERGEVAEVERVGPEAGFGFDQAAVAVARATAWTPATRGGVPIEAWVELKLEFQP
jgi:protein TonB